MELSKAGTVLMVLSAILLIGSIVFVFVLEPAVGIPWLVLGHVLIIVAAIGLKVGYFMRLEAEARPLK